MCLCVSRFRGIPKRYSTNFPGKRPSNIVRSNKLISLVFLKTLVWIHDIPRIRSINFQRCNIFNSNFYLDRRNGGERGYSTTLVRHFPYIQCYDVIISVHGYFSKLVFRRKFQCCNLCLKRLRNSLKENEEEKLCDIERYFVEQISQNFSSKRFSTM